MVVQAPNMSENDKIVIDWNNTKADFPQACLHQLFEQNVAAAPGATAILYRDQCVTYADLNRRANSLANYLLDVGVTTETLVAICFERSVDMVVAILAVLKAGGAYLPIDPSYPEDRIRFMLNDTQAKIVLTQSGLATQIEGSDARVIATDSESQTISAFSVESPPCSVSPEQLCYVIYTSGSTGKPKGIALCHRGVVNNIFDLNESFEVGNDCRMMAISALGFDMCVYETLGALASGGAIVMPEQWGLKDPSHWADLIHKHKVTVWNSAPALLEMLVGHVENRPDLQPLPIRLAIQGGDWEPITLPDRLWSIAPKAQIVVLGGATEASIHSIVFPVSSIDPQWKSIPYGKPMRNQTAYILDADLNPTGIGQPGELHLGGIGLARGYFNRPELTAEKFIAHPFDDDPAARIYKTGDLAQWMPDGNIELLGRMDFQIKLRGHRIELGEITASLVEHAQVSQAVVILREDSPGDQRLVAYMIVQDLEENVPADRLDAAVTDWANIYDDTYAHESHKDSQLNFIGWNSSYTGKTFSDNELTEMLRHTVDRILMLNPQKILEVGCGTGLILLSVAPQVESYVASDLSSVGVTELQAKLDANGGMEHVELSSGAAHELRGSTNSYDTVILNSVLQHFPEIDYLTDFIKSAIATVSDNGTMFIGDVRSRPLLETFHTSIEVFQADDTLPIDALRTQIQRRTRNEKELVVDAEYFLTLGALFDRIDNVSVVLKRGSHHNEFNTYHYDVYIRVGESKQTCPDVTYLKWNIDVHCLADIRTQLETVQSPVVRVTSIENARVANAAKLRRTLSDNKSLRSVRDLTNAVDKAAVGNAIDPEDIWQLEKSLPFAVDLCIAVSDDEGRFDAVFVHESMVESVDLVNIMGMTSDRKLDRKNDKQLANRPDSGSSRDGLIPELRRKLQAEMPEYMVPQDFVLLDHFPVTPNGKVDRKALPQPDQLRPTMDEDFVKPQTALQEALAMIWTEILGINKIGIQDGFIALGGHSLKATQTVSRINETFGVDIGLGEFLNIATIDGLSSRITQIAEELGTDVTAIAKAYLEISQLSNEEIDAMVNQPAAENA